MNADGSDRVRLTDHPAEDFDPVWSPDGSLIAFRSHRDGNEEVYVMAADGSEQTNLTSHPDSDYSPAWSPDGSMIAFATNRDADSGGNDIYLMRADGSDLTRLTVGGGIDEYPTWSPDGRQIAYACTGGRVLPEGVGDFEICAMDADGDNQRQLTDADGVSGYPAWSPDGSTIAFMTTRDGWPTLPDYVPPAYESGEFGEYEIYLIDADGANPRNVTNNGRENEQFPAWSPDGYHLIFSRYGCLVVSTPDGAESSPITDTACSDSFPDWRAELGAERCIRWISFVDERNGQTDLFKVASDGTNLTQLTNDAMSEFWPAWSPDGKTIAFQVDSESGSDIFLIGSDGEGPRQLTFTPGLDLSPDWAEDGSSLIVGSEGEVDRLALYVLPLDGGSMVSIPGTEGGANPEWSPDGSQIVYRKELPGNDEIAVTDAGGLFSRNLTNTRANDFDPTWSPNGARIAFESLRDGNYEIYSVRVDGSQLLRLTEDPLSDQGPAWSPDGSTILYSHHGELFIMDPDGSNQRPLSDSEAVTGNFAAWGPCLASDS